MVFADVLCGNHLTVPHNGADVAYVVMVSSSIKTRSAFKTKGALLSSLLECLNTHPQSSITAKMYNICANKS